MADTRRHLVPMAYIVLTKEADGSYDTTKKELVLDTNDAMKMLMTPGFTVNHLIIPVNTQELYK